MEGTGEKFNCELCLKTFQNKKGLTKHVKYKWCDYQSQSKDEDMNKHYWNAHREEVVQEEIDAFNGFKRKSHSCGHCRDKFGNRLCTTRKQVCCVQSWIKLFQSWYIEDGQDILICSTCYKHILTCEKIKSVAKNQNSGKDMLYNLSEETCNLYRVTFYNTRIWILPDPKPCILCRDPVAELKDPHWSTNPTFLELKHGYIHCPVLREPRQRILGELSSVLIEESQEGTTSKALDSSTINALFSDNTTLFELFMEPSSSLLPKEYRFKSYDPKRDKIFGLGRKLGNIWYEYVKDSINGE